VGNNKIFCELTELSKATISQHLKGLKKAKIVSTDYIIGEPKYQLHHSAQHHIARLISELAN